MKKSLENNIKSKKDAQNYVCVCACAGACCDYDYVNIIWVYQN